MSTIITEPNFTAERNNAPSPGHPGEVSPRSGDGGGLPGSQTPVEQTQPNKHSNDHHLSPILLDDILDPSLTPARICHLHDITLAQLRIITESPEFKQAMTDTKAIYAARQDTIRNQLYTQALSAANDLITEAALLAEQNRTCTTDPRPAAITPNPEAHRRALNAATRHHAANARLLETRRKAINTIIKECKPDNVNVAMIEGKTDSTPARHRSDGDVVSNFAERYTQAQSTHQPASSPGHPGEVSPRSGDGGGLPHSHTTAYNPRPNKDNEMNTPEQPTTQKDHPAQSSGVARESRFDRTDQQAVSKTRMKASRGEAASASTTRGAKSAKSEHRQRTGGRDIAVELEREVEVGVAFREPGITDRRAVVAEEPSPSSG